MDEDGKIVILLFCYIRVFHELFIYLLLFTFKVTLLPLFSLRFALMGITCLIETNILVFFICCLLAPPKALDCCLKRSTPDDWNTNVETIVQRSPFSDEAELLGQFNLIKEHGTRIYTYNLWEDDQWSLISTPTNMIFL